MKLDRQTRLIICSSTLLVVAGIVTFAIRYRRAAASLNDPNPAVRVATLRATGYEGHVDLLRKALQDEDADVRSSRSCSYSGEERKPLQVRRSW